MTAGIIPHSRPWINNTDETAVSSVLRSGMIARGDQVREFEQAVASWLGVKSSIACTSGTSALILALKSLGIDEGDEVLIPTYVCWNVLAAITAVGARPRLCDVDYTGVLTAQTVQAARTNKSKAIVAVHTYGHPCNISSLNRFELPVIEDACQAFGLNVNGSAVGTIGTLGVYSLHATKCLTTGEGGMLVARSDTLLNKARNLTKSIDLGNVTAHASMTDLQATLGKSQLARYPVFLARRRILFADYHQCLATMDNVRPNYHGAPGYLFRFTFRTRKDFEAVQAGFLARGVQVRRGVDDLLHRLLGLKDRDFPIASKLFEQTVSIPFYPSLSDDEVEQVLYAMRDVFSGA